MGDGFISLIRMLIVPVVFLTVVLGIAGATDVKKAGRVGLKSLVYFEVVSTFALALGLLVVHLLRPGEGFSVDRAALDPKAASDYVQQPQSLSITRFLLHIIPTSFADAFTSGGDLLQVLLVAVLFGVALSRMGATGRPVIVFLESLSGVFFNIVGLVMRLAPVGAGAAMAFTIGKYGISSLGPLLKLMGSFYLACVLFVVGVLGVIARLAGFSIFGFLRNVREELLLVLGSSSSESALVPLMQKLERMGCSRSVVGLVVPSGYSFNLDGTNIYLTIAALFIAQALNVPLTATQEATLLGVAMLTSRGASGVTGAGFITLAASAGSKSNSVSAMFKISNFPWNSSLGMKVPRDDVAVAAVGSQFFVMGGTSPTAPISPHPPVATVEIFDASTGAWSAGPDMPTPLDHMTARAVNGKIYVVGGRTSTSACSELTRVYVLEPSTQTWTTRSAVPTPVQSATAAVIGTQIYVIGGEAANICPNRATAMVNVYDTSTDLWRSLAPLPTAATELGSGVVNGKIEAFGGLNDPVGASVLALAEYDPVTNGWTSRAGVTGVANAATVSFGGLVYALGGLASSTANSAYDPVKDTWIQKEALPPAAVVNGPAADVYNGRIYTFNYNGSFVYNPADDIH